MEPPSASDLQLDSVEQQMDRLEEHMERFEVDLQDFHAALKRQTRTLLVVTMSSILCAGVLGFLAGQLG